MATSFKKNPGERRADEPLNMQAGRVAAHLRANDFRPTKEQIEVLSIVADVYETGDVARAAEMFRRATEFRSALDASPARPGDPQQRLLSEAWFEEWTHARTLLFRPIAHLYAVDDRTMGTLWFYTSWTDAHGQNEVAKFLKKETMSYRLINAINESDGMRIVHRSGRASVDDEALNEFLLGLAMEVLEMDRGRPGGLNRGHLHRHNPSMRGGRAYGMTPSQFDRGELARGQRHEMEHTDDPSVAEGIAMDHLAEDPRYYRKLEAMEKKRNPSREVLREPWAGGDRMVTTIVIEEVQHRMPSDTHVVWSKGERYGHLVGGRPPIMYSAWLESASGNRLPISFGGDVPASAQDALHLAKRFLRGVASKSSFVPVEKSRDDDEMALNPGTPPAASDAVNLYQIFWKMDPKDIGEFHRDFAIPARVELVGDAEWITYQSGKTDPETLQVPKEPINYIHDFDDGVQLFAPGTGVDVPAYVREAKALTLLGVCLGWQVETDRGTREATATDPMPELYAIPSGKALLVIQDKREVLAIFWGGKLTVEARGIVH